MPLPTVTEASRKGRLKDYTGSIIDNDEAIRLDPKLANAYNLRGVSYIYLGKLTTAMENFETCFRLDPNEHHAIGNKSILLSASPDESMHNSKLSLELAKQAELIDATNGYVLNALSCAYAANNDFEKAIEYQERALQDEEWKKNDGIAGGVLATERIAKWGAKEQWTFSIEK